MGLVPRTILAQIWPRASAGAVSSKGVPLLADSSSSAYCSVSIAERSLKHLQGFSRKVDRVMTFDPGIGADTIRGIDGTDINIEVGAKAQVMGGAYVVVAVEQYTDASTGEVLAIDVLLGQSR